MSGLPKGGAQARVYSLDSATVLAGNTSYILVGPTGTYSFDNFQMTAEDLSNTTYGYDAASQLTSMTANGATTNYTYDAWGRMAGKTQSSYAATYGYRYGDKLAWATSNFPGENAVMVYDYDGLGKRRRETVDNSAMTWFRWSGWEESAEYTGTIGSWTVGAKQTGYVPGLAAYAGSNPATADWHFFLNDHLGSPRQMLGQDKSGKARFDFAPYGELIRSAGLPLTVGYTGHRWDPAIGQYFTPFRYYNPQTARWNMRDPLGAVNGPNVYAYVQSNPTGSYDPLGLQQPCPGNTNPPSKWPIPNDDKWTWNNEYGGYQKGSKYAYWHPAGNDRDGNDGDSKGHGPGHWDLADKKGNRLGKRPNLDKTTAEKLADALKNLIDSLIDSLPSPAGPSRSGPISMPSLPIPWYHDPMESGSGSCPSLLEASKI